MPYLQKLDNSTGKMKSYYVFGKKRSKKITQIHDSEKVYLSGPLSEVSDDIEKLIEKFGLDAILELETYSEYGDTYSQLTVSWSRDMTEEELRAYETQQRAAKNQREDREKQEFERLLKSHPEWVKDELK